MDIAKDGGEHRTLLVAPSQPAAPRIGLCMMGRSFQRRDRMTTLLLTMLVMLAGLPQHPQHDMAAKVMGFDQTKTSHHFRLYADGGAIEVTVKDPADATNLTAIRAHLPHVAQLFAQGNFESPMLVHDTPTVPGTPEMTKLKGRIEYAYGEMPAGGRIDIRTTDPAAIKAVHAFLTFQIADHKTGDSLVVQPRRLTRF
jgi:hypothetical protein